MNINKWLTIYKKYRSCCHKTNIVIINNKINSCDNIKYRYENAETVKKYNNYINELDSLDINIDIFKLNYFESIKCSCKFNFKNLNENKLNNQFNKL